MPIPFPFPFPTPFPLPFPIPFPFPFPFPFPCRIPCTPPPPPPRSRPSASWSLLYARSCLAIPHGRLRWPPDETDRDPGQNDRPAGHRVGRRHLREAQPGQER